MNDLVDKQRPGAGDMSLSGFDSSSLTGLLEGTDSGLALFDVGLRLVYCNARYRELCGYSLADVQPGVALEELARLSMARTSADAANADVVVRRGLERLSVAGGYSFRFRSPTGVGIYVHRRMLDDGRRVRAVRCGRQAGCL